MKLKKEPLPNRDGGTAEFNVYLSAETNTLNWIAKIRNSGHPNNDHPWQILRRKDRQDEKWSGDFKTADEAVTELEKEY